MALRDQPYFPLFVDDFLADEKLAECSPAAHGIYVRLLCLMHKSEQYGVIFADKNEQILIESMQKNDEFYSKFLKFFAKKLARKMPFSAAEINRGLAELVSKGVVQVTGCNISQKRMLRDAEISKKRAGAANNRWNFAYANK